MLGGQRHLRMERPTGHTGLENIVLIKDPTGNETNVDFQVTDCTSPVMLVREQTAKGQSPGPGTRASAPWS